MTPENWQAGGARQLLSGTDRLAIAKHNFAVGDLVALSTNVSFLTGKRSVWRISLRQEDLFMLVPLDCDDPRPRLGTLDNMTLVEAWRGHPLVRCNADASEFELAI